MNSRLEKYLSGRAELRRICAERLMRDKLPISALRTVFWGEFDAGDDRLPFAEDASELPRGNFTAPDFTAPVTHTIEDVGIWRRLCVTTTWLLELNGVNGAEEWFSTLSGKNRKKLRWLRNALPKLGATVSALDVDAGFDDFGKLYSAQFPRHRYDSPELAALRAIYCELAARGCAVTRILRDAAGAPLAAALGYIGGKSMFYTHLTRTRGEFDKYSPGYYLTYAVISEMLTEHPEVEDIFLGPGEYDYKSALGGVAYPVFRYERNEWRNCFGLIRLRHREKKELRRARGE